MRMMGLPDTKKSPEMCHVWHFIKTHDCGRLPDKMAIAQYLLSIAKWYLTQCGKTDVQNETTEWITNQTKLGIASNNLVVFGDHDTVVCANSCFFSAVDE